MRRVLKGLGIALGGLAVLALVALAYVYVASELTLRRAYDVPLSPVDVPADSAAVAEGRRLAAVLGCYDGCHGEGLDGGLFYEEAGIARLVAPNLTRVAAEHTDAELGRVIRHGVRRDGTSTWGMPSASFYHLSDEDLGAILAFLRSAPLTEGPGTDVRVGPLGRLGVILGEFPPQAAAIDHDAPRLGAHDPSDRVALGRYLAVTACSECHGMDLRGGPMGTAPNLVAAAAYPEGAFVRLMRAGVALGDRELRLMSGVARRRFSHLTDGEIGALHEYLKTLAAPDAGGSP